MEQIILNIKDHSKLPLLLEFLQLFKFVEVQQKHKPEKEAEPADIFASAGIWKGRDISAKQIREEAWKKRK